MRLPDTSKPGGLVQHEGVVDEYTEWLRSWGAAEKTVTARRTLARARLREWGLDGMTAQNIQTWLANGRKPNGDPWSRWTRSTYHSSMVDLCAWLVVSGYLDENPMTDMRRPGKPHSLPRPLSEAEAMLVLNAAGGKVRDWIRLALLAGLRVHEIAKVRGEDVTVDHIYVEGKGGVRAELPTHPEIWEMAQRYPRHGYWFPGRGADHTSPNTITLQVGALFRTLGITGSIHRARHTYGTRLLRDPATNIRTVQRLMRHANLNTTAAYTAVDDAELRDAIRRLSA